MAYYDLCQERGVKKYPTTMLYKDGVFLDKVRGRKNMTLVTNMMEKGLEAAKPGSRPANFVPPDVVIREKDDPFAPVPSPKEKNSEVPPAGDAAVTDATDATDATTVEEKPQDNAAQQPVEEKPQGDAPQQAVEEKPQDNAAQQPAGEKPQDSAAQAGEEKPQDNAAQKTVEEEPQANVAAPVVVQEVAKTTPTDYPVFPDPDVVLPTTPKSTVTPNPKGESFSLTAESFQNHVTMTQDPWFIKFYAPWCSHCEALAPTWEQLGKDMKGRLNVGEVNCDQESRLCKDVRVSGYPTIILFKGPERVEYNGLRGLGDFKHFAESAVELTSGIPDVTAEEFAALEEKEPVIFTYFYDHGASTEDFMALERIPMNLIGRAKLVRTRDPDMYRRFKITTWPRLMVAREGRPTYYTPITPKDMRDINAILKWMKSVWLPIVPELTAANAREIMDGKMVVLGILNRDDQDAFASAQREMKSAANEWMDKQVQLFQLERQELRDAKQLRIEEAQDRDDNRALRQAKAIRINMDMSDKKQVAFAWVDGVFWQRWIRTTYGIDVKDGDRVIINDEDVSIPLGIVATVHLLTRSRTAGTGTTPSRATTLARPAPRLWRPSARSRRSPPRSSPSSLSRAWRRSSSTSK